ncbi:MAG: GNAT family N-acetyltransferase [Bacteroidota bacterium]|nr:GNAT family N-acetyltransferase [Bacteroidota bacterium]
MIEIKRYSSDVKGIWDNFIKSSRNGSFLFYRDYMDYHSDRFNDSSYLFYKKTKLIAVLPGNINDQKFYSHQGLTYGGLVQDKKTTAADVLNSFDALKSELLRNKIIELIYKPIPIIFHKIPSQEDIYALFKNNAVKIGCNISSTIYQKNKIRFSRLRRSGIRKSQRNHVIVEESEDFESFWKILSENLSHKYGVNPVHSLKEIKLLKSKFPDNIKLFVSRFEDQIVSGTVVYVYDNIIRAQYASANEIGKKIGSLDFMFDYLINNRYKDIPVFDFGQSTEEMGNYLNLNLIFPKEGFGGRGIVYDIYKMRLGK